MSIDSSKYNTIVNVRNIDENFTNEQLKAMFGMYGTVTSCKVMNFSDVTLGRFAYVAFEDPDAAEDAIIELNGQEISQGQRISVRRTHEKLIRPSRIEKNAASLKKKEESLTKNISNRCDIYVKNLAPVINSYTLRDMFQHCGTIISTKIVKDIDGRSKGYGFVIFATPEEAKKAVDTMNGHQSERNQFLSLRVAVASGTNYSLSAQGTHNTTNYIRYPGVRFTHPARTSRSYADQIQEMIDRTGSIPYNMFATD